MMELYFLGHDHGRLETTAMRVGRASAMAYSLELVNSDKVDIWAKEAAVWEKRRDAIVASSPTPTTAASIAAEFTREAYLAALPDPRCFEAIFPT